MTRTYRKIMTIAMIAMMSAALLVQASAMDFSVTPELPDNQRRNGNSFFDLMVQPGQSQDLVIEIANLSDVEILVLLEAITASTSRNGQINYSARGLLDESMQFSFEDLVTLPASQFVIPAQSSIQVPIGLTIPDSLFEGTLLGSIRVLREATQEEKDAAGAIVNQYAHVTAVRLVQSESADAIAADFELGGISAELINFRASIVAEIRNTQPKVIKGARATAAIYAIDDNQQVVFEHTMETLDLAPNSIFPYSFVDREGYGIEAGDYRAVIEIEYEGQSWSFEETFTIDPAVAAEINDNAVNQQGQVRPNISADSITGLPIWAVIAIAGGAAVISAMAVAIIMLARKRRDPFHGLAKR